MKTFYAIVLVSLACLSSSWGAVLPYSSSAMVKSERSGDNFAYSITQNQQSISPISRALPLTAQMPLIAGSAGYPIHGGLLPQQSLPYASQPSILMPHHPLVAAAPAPAPSPAIAYNPHHLLMTQPQAHVPLPHPQYLH
ncbi:protein PRRC2C-like isoform X2 [Nilaparvata lugens]|uniref:protein PRRC2C-like isoform X1 n=1 Tax=Nilaparvata lugens TaxID=108931 RepID=UPI00193CCF4C|nr:protein PRRC2C-like isoform X1 [Nilaparvata lugens]XP_039293634.1 protein PRRC2C-like isoform X2 [Nilaparvata lugens]